jgi:probable addiction module antidote protein
VAPDLDENARRRPLEIKMKKAKGLKTTKWDVADHLDSPDAIAAYLEAVFEDGNPALVAAALGDVARARGMTKIAREAGLTRASLYKALSADGRPEFATVMKVLSALGFKLKFAA